MMPRGDSIECVGLIPAAGKAKRISPLPCSKEILPVGFGDLGPNGRKHPKVVGHYLLEAMRLAGARRAYIVLSREKLDIPAYFGSGAMVKMALAYLMTEQPYGVPFTLDSAYPFLKNKRILFGFPDILIHPEEVFVRLNNRMDSKGGDIVLGLFEADDPRKMDMVALDGNGAVCGIHIKPTGTTLRWSWIVAVWSDRFTEFIRDYVRRFLMHMEGSPQAADTAATEIHLGEVIRSALESDLKVDHLCFDQGRYIDIGTPGDLARAVH